MCIRDSGGDLLAIDVQHIAHGLERVKRDAQRQQQPDVAERDRQPYGREDVYKRQDTARSRR